MPPKKKNPILPYIYVIGFIFAIYVGLNAALVYETVEQMLVTGEIQKNQQVLTFISLLAECLEEMPLTFRFNEFTKTSLLYCGVGWLVIVAAIESSRKNYIHGKEFGTSRWGTFEDIHDLFASTLEKLDIKRAKKMLTPWGRWAARRKVYKDCENEGNAIKSAKLKELKAAEEINKYKGKANKKLYREKVEAIDKEIKELVASTKQGRWKPDQLKAEFEKLCKDIDNNHFLSEEEKAEEKADAKKEYEKKLRDFYNPGYQIVKIKEKYKDADMLLTASERISLYNWVLNNNTLILGGSGSGKTRGYVMPNILQAHSSYVITDPKGEILEKAGYFLSEIKGYKIRVLNLDEKAHSDYYNPFVYVHPARPGYEERVLELIETIIINTEGGEKKAGPDPFWPMAERLFLQSIFFFTVDAFIPEERNMNTVLALIGMLQIGEEEDNMDSDLDRFVRRFAAKFGENHIGVQQYREFRSKASGKTAKSIVISAVARLAPFRTPEVQRIFSDDSMHLDLVGEEKTAVFVVVPPTTTTFNFIAGCLFTQLFQELQYCAAQKHKHEGQRLPVPVRFILDEFANTCTVPNFVKILAYARSFGIGITPILQSLEQIKNMYEKEWGVIIDNCNSLLYLGSITHGDTLDYVSKLLGKGTFDKRTTGRTLGSRGSSSRNEDVVGRELMDSSEIRKLPKSDCLLVVGGRPPFYSKKYDYTSHPNYRFTSDANKGYSFHIEEYRDKVAKEEAEAKCAAAAQKKSISTHGEENVVLTPSENAVVEVTPIRMETDPVKQLGRITANVANMEPISNEEIRVDDGENTAATVGRKLFDELVGEEESEKAASKAALRLFTLSDATKAILEEKEKDKIRVDDNLLHTVNRIGRSSRNLVPIPDEELKVDDGESSASVDERAVEFILDSDDDVDQEALHEAIQDDVDNIAEILSGYEFPDGEMPMPIGVV